MTTSYPQNRLRIVVLFHEVDGQRDFGCYGIHQLVTQWRADGHEVLFSYGPGREVTADVLIMHVDVSVVPTRYVEYARRHPLVLNGRILDIRKSTFSRQLVSLLDPWTGPVIVKTERNYGGEPERIRERSGLLDRAARRAQNWWSRKQPGVPSYPIYDHKMQVPKRYFTDARFVVERFLPERDEQGLYCTRSCLFFGAEVECYALHAAHPIVNARTALRVTKVPVPSDLITWKAELQMDFGKLDYVEVEGRPVLLDVNKTVGSAPARLTPADLERSRQRRARALYPLVVQLRSQSVASSARDSPDPANIE